MNAAERRGLTALEYVACKAMNELLDLDVESLDWIEVREYIDALRASANLVLRALEVRLPEGERVARTEPVVEVQINRPEITVAPVRRRGRKATNPVEVIRRCEAVERHGFDLVLAAEELGITRYALYDTIKNHAPNVLERYQAALSERRAMMMRERWASGKIQGSTRGLKIARELMEVQNS